ncbi:hypothetical protein SeLEV6574_g06240 [Synchytrium endobioticum]|uniref:DUF1746 domain-containing protein n=1 Tax=Synchytrium endobioticum TaxID=286115 RepID=A0A507CPS7_9FUNG|nr:hypothetical protein SeLEV6574_g06240 [Synchytrium endobioticum]
MLGSGQHSFTQKSLLRSVEHVIAVNFIYIYLLDISLFGLFIRGFAQVFISHIAISKQLKLCIYFVLASNVLFAIRHYSLPEGYPLIIDFIEQKTPSRLHLVLLDTIICLGQLFRVLVVWTMKEAFPPSSNNSPVVIISPGSVSIVPGVPRLSIRWPWLRRTNRRPTAAVAGPTLDPPHMGETMPGAIPLRPMSATAGSLSASASRSVSTTSIRSSSIASSSGRPVIMPSSPLSLPSAASIPLAWSSQIPNRPPIPPEEVTEDHSDQDVQSPSQRGYNNPLVITPVIELDLLGMIRTFTTPNQESRPSDQPNSYNLPV